MTATFVSRRRPWSVRVSVLLTALAGAEVFAGQLGSRPADEWAKTLESPGRVQSLKVDETVAKLRLKPGDVVADPGAGTGVFGRIAVVEYHPELGGHRNQPELQVSRETAATLMGGAGFTPSRTFRSSRRSTSSSTGAARA